VVADELYARVFKVVPVNILSEISIYKKMDKHRLQLQGEADVFWKFSKETITQLAKLALLLLNVHPRGAGLECVFGASGIYHNSRRNRLGYRKALKMVRAKTDLLSKDPRSLRMKGLLMEGNYKEEVKEDKNDNENEKDEGEEDESDSCVVIPYDDNEESVQSDEEEVTLINDEVVFDSNISLAPLIDLKFDWKGFFESLK